jgi:hypothetical protein
MLWYVIVQVVYHLFILQSNGRLFNQSRPPTPAYLIHGQTRPAFLVLLCSPITGTGPIVSRQVPSVPFLRLRTIPAGYQRHVSMGTTKPDLRLEMAAAPRNTCIFPTIVMNSTECRHCQRIPHNRRYAPAWRNVFQQGLKHGNLPV